MFFRLAAALLVLYGKKKKHNAKLDKEFDERDIIL